MLRKQHDVSPSPGVPRLPDPPGYLAEVGDGEAHPSELLPDGLGQAEAQGAAGADGDAQQDACAWGAQVSGGVSRPVTAPPVLPPPCRLALTGLEASTPALPDPRGSGHLSCPEPFFLPFPTAKFLARVHFPRSAAATPRSSLLPVVAETAGGPDEHWDLGSAPQLWRQPRRRCTRSARPPAPTRARALRT